MCLLFTLTLQVPGAWQLAGLTVAGEGSPVIRTSVLEVRGSGFILSTPCRMWLALVILMGHMGTKVPCQQTWHLGVWH